VKRLVAIPVFNEEPHIRDVLECIRKYYDGDLLLVNDGSTDGSSEIIESLKAVFRLTHLRRADNQGYGRSIIDSFKYALENGYDQLVTLDCDEQHEPEFIPEFFRGIEGADVCSGSRYLSESEKNDVPPPDRLEINRRVTKIINKVTGYELTDSFCGMKGYRVKALQGLDLKEAGYGFPIEFWIQAGRLGLVVKEFPISRIYKNQSRTFGRELDDPSKRMDYYQTVFEKELKRWSISLPSELIRTM
jgi:dolichol-phosphate mannosyltransferase